MTICVIAFHYIWCSPSSGNVPWLSRTVARWNRITSLELNGLPFSYVQPMRATHLRDITNTKQFLIVITNFTHILEQYHLVRLILMYTFMRHCSFQMCSYIYPKSFDAGLTNLSKIDVFLKRFGFDFIHSVNIIIKINFQFQRPMELNKYVSSFPWWRLWN